MADRGCCEDVRLEHRRLGWGQTREAILATKELWTRDEAESTASTTIFRL
jgi:hypothetical protein